jgi:hypothetical protein
MAAQLDENIQYTDPSTGELLNNGYIYIGDDGLDAKINPQTIYADRELTIPLVNPQRVGSDGRALNKIWVAGKYSMKVENYENVQKLNDLSLGEIAQVGNTVLSNVAGADAITADASPTITALVDKQIYIFTAASTNTGAMTLTIDLTSTYPIKKYHDQAMQTGDVEANQVVSVAWNATDSVFELQSVCDSTGIDDNATSTAMTIDANEDISYVGTAQYGAGEGVVFNGDAIAAANTLDDYEEGSWTPIYIGSVTAGNHTYTTQVGSYEKIGRKVRFRCRVTLATKGTISGNISIGGLPFTSSADISSFGSISVGTGVGLAITAGENVTGIVQINDTTAPLKIWSATTGAIDLTDAELTGTAQFILSGQYYVD